jgi:hypothetical protein
LEDHAMMLADVGRWLMVVGAMIFVSGLLLSLAGRLPGLGALPGDIAIERGGVRFYAPLGTMLVLSLLLTLILNIAWRLFR